MMDFDLNLNINETSELSDDIILNRKNGLLICQWNVNNITNKIETLLNYIIITKNPDIFLLQEINKLYNIIDFNFSIKGYNTFTMNANYGNVIILARDSLNVRSLDIDRNCNFEIEKNINELDNNSNNKEEKLGLIMSRLYVIAIEIIGQNHDDKYIILNYYRPQNGVKGGSDIKLLLDYIDIINNKRKYCKHKFIVGGDFNAHHSLWMNNKINNKYSKATKSGDLLENWLYRKRWNVLNNGDNTRIMNDNYTSPDVTFINNNINYEDVEWWIEDYGRGKFASDHLTIFIYIHDCVIHESPRLEYCIRNGDNLNWEKWKEELSKNESIWYSNFGIKLNDFINLYISKLNNNENDKIEVDKLKEIVNINDKLIIDAVEDLMNNVIVKTSKEIFGLRIKNKYQRNPWMTIEIKNAIDDYIRFKKKFYTYSKRKRKIFKDKLNYYCKIKDDLVSEGKLNWIKKIISKQNDKSCTSWSDINKIINYETISNKNIPNWYDPVSNELIADTAEKKAVLYLEHLHRFDDCKKDDVVNEDYDKLWNNYKDNIINSIHNEKWKNELEILNGIITKKEIRRSINSFDAN